MQTVRSSSQPSTFLTEASKIADLNEELAHAGSDLAPRNSSRKSPSKKRIDFSDSDDEDAVRWAREVESEEELGAGSILMGSRTRPSHHFSPRTCDEDTPSPRPFKPEEQFGSATPATVLKNPAFRAKKREPTPDMITASFARQEEDDCADEQVGVKAWSRDQSPALPMVTSEEEGRQLSLPTKMDAASTHQPSPRQHSPRQPSPRQPSPRQPSPPLSRPLAPTQNFTLVKKKPVRAEKSAPKEAQEESRARRQKMHRARREAALSSDSDDDNCIDDSGVREVILTPPRKLLEKVDSRYHTAEHKLDAAESARALQRSPPKRSDHYAKAQRRTMGMVSSDEDEDENERLDAYIAREKSTRGSYPAPKDNRARAASPEYKRAQRIARSRSPPGGLEAPPSRRAALRTLSNSRTPSANPRPRGTARSASPPASGHQHGEKIVVWVAVAAEAEDAASSPWGLSAQEELPADRRDSALADPPCSYCGVQQGLDLGRFMLAEGVCKVLASPCLSALQTAQHSAWPLHVRVAVEPGLVPPRHVSHTLPPLAKRLNYVPSLDLSYQPCTSEATGEEEELAALPRVLDAAMKLEQGLSGGDKAMVVADAATALAVVAALTANQRRGPVTEASKLHMLRVLLRQDGVRAAGVYKVERCARTGLWACDYKCYNFYLSKPTTVPHPWRSYLAPLPPREWVPIWDDLANRYASRRVSPVPGLPLSAKGAHAPPVPVNTHKKLETSRSRSVGRPARISFVDDDDDDDDDIFVDPRSRVPRSRIPASPLKMSAWSPRRYEARTKQMRAR